VCCECLRWVGKYGTKREQDDNIDKNVADSKSNNPVNFKTSVGLGYKSLVFLNQLPIGYSVDKLYVLLLLYLPPICFSCLLAPNDATSSALLVYD
jgi:hypothetical protein